MKSKAFRASNLVEVGAGQDTGSCMLPKLEIPDHYLYTYRKWAGSLFTSGFVHNFTHVKVKEVCFIVEWTFLNPINVYSSHLKMLLRRRKLALL